MTDDIVTRLRELREVLMGNPIMAREVQEAMDEIERLRAELKDSDDDFHALKAMFDKMRADRDRWRSLADLAHESLFNPMRTIGEFLKPYEEAVRGE